MIRRKRHTQWVIAKRKQDLRFYPLWVVIGTIARFLYRVRHWDWSDHVRQPEPPLGDIVAGFGAPVYGLVDDFMALIPDGRSYGGDSIGLNYQVDWLESEEARPGVCIESRKGSNMRGPWPWVGLQVKSAAFGALWSFNSQSFRNREMSTFGDPSGLIDRFHMEAVSDVPLEVTGFPSRASLWRWNVPEPVFVAVFNSERISLTLSTFGLTIEQLAELCGHIGPLNEQPDLMIMYREQADARWKAHERRLIEGDIS
jgi:hypothetical protein